MIKITFPDGSVREYNEGVNGLQIAESISSRLAQDVLACGVNGETYDLGRPINEDADFVLYKWDDEEGKHAFWHTSAHLLAEALQAQFQHGDVSGHDIWIERLLVDYYDPIYLRHLRDRAAKIVFEGDASACREYLQALSFQPRPQAR